MIVRRQTGTPINWMSNDRIVHWSVVILFFKVKDGTLPQKLIAVERIVPNL